MRSRQTADDSDEERHAAYEGRLVNLIGGDTVRWDFGGGRIDEMSIRDTSRIYLNTWSARNIFNYIGGCGRAALHRCPRPRAPAAWAARRSLAAASAVATGGTLFTVRGNSAWTDTGMNVNRNDRYIFTADGQVCYSRNEPATTPDGHPVQMNPAYPVPGLGVGGS